MKIIGRDKLLREGIYPRLNRKTSFVLIGQRGIGKSTLIKSSYEHYKGRKVLTSCITAFGDILREIARVLEIEGFSKMRVKELETHVSKECQGVAIFLDSIEPITPKLSDYFTVLNECNHLYLSGVNTKKEHIKRLIWGKKIIRVVEIAKQDRKRLASYVVETFGSNTPASQISTMCRGVPGRAVALAKGEIVRHGDIETVEGEEVNIAPVLLIVVVGFVCLRFIGRGMDAPDMYMLGGIGTGLAIFLRFFIFRGMQK